MTQEKKLWQNVILRACLDAVGSSAIKKHDYDEVIAMYQSMRKNADAMYKRYRDALDEIIIICDYDSSAAIEAIEDVARKALGNEPAAAYQAAHVTTETFQ